MPGGVGGAKPRGFPLSRLTAKDNKEMKSIALIILVSISLCSIATAQPPTYDKKCTAIVNGQTAQVTFPLPKGQTLTWDMADTSDDAMEYSWEVCLEQEGMPCKYNFGVLHFKFGRSEEKGLIRELIFISQKSVWDKTNTVRQDLTIEADIEHDNLIDTEPAHLIIKITDKKTFAELFSNNPTVAHCTVKTPYRDINFKSKTQIKYNK